MILAVWRDSRPVWSGRSCRSEEGLQKVVGDGWFGMKRGPREEGRQPSRLQDCQGPLQPSVDPGEGSAEGAQDFC